MLLLQLFQHLLLLKTQRNISNRFELEAECESSGLTALPTTV